MLDHPASKQPSPGSLVEVRTAFPYRLQQLVTSQALLLGWMIICRKRFECTFEKNRPSGSKRLDNRVRLPPDRQHLLNVLIGSDWTFERLPGFLYAVPAADLSQHYKLVPSE